MAPVRKSCPHRFCMILAFVMLAGIHGVPTAFAETVVRDWVALHNGPGESRDTARAMAVDGAGNVYVTGDSRSDFLYDYTTVKFDPAGNRLWAARFNGTGDGDDRALSIAADTAGNVVVTGHSHSGMETGTDFATVKYDSNGNELWIAGYAGPGGSSDNPEKVAVDASGNVHVTGSRFGGGLPSDFVTIKYGPDGNERWVAIHADGSASALALDPAGNVHVTGNSSGAFIAAK